MGPRLTIERVDGVPSEGRVHHYDELEERAKHRLPELEPGTQEVDEETHRALSGCDVVKFTEYYRLRAD